LAGLKTVNLTQQKQTTQQQKSNLKQKTHKMLNLTNTQKLNLNLKQTLKLQELLTSVHIIVYNCHTQHSTGQNSSDNFPSYRPDDHCGSDAVDGRRGVKSSIIYITLLRTISVTLYCLPYCVTTTTTTTTVLQPFVQSRTGLLQKKYSPTHLS